MLPILEQMRSGKIPAGETDTSVAEPAKKIKCQTCAHYNPDDRRAVQVGGIAQYQVHSGMPLCDACNGQTCLMARSDKLGRCGVQAKLFVPKEQFVTTDEGREGDAVKLVAATEPAAPSPSPSPRKKRPSELKKEAAKKGLAARLPKELTENVPPPVGTVPVHEHFIDDGEDLDTQQ